MTHAERDKLKAWLVRFEAILNSTMKKRING